MSEEVKKHHTSVYIPKELEDRVNDYLMSETGSTYGRNQLILDAIEEYLNARKC